MWTCLFFGSLAIISWKISQLVATPIISHTLKTAGLSLDPLVLHHFVHSTSCSLVLPVKTWHVFELLVVRSFSVDPNGFGWCKHDWPEDPFADGLGKDKQL